ncbi:unnamed protein product, partial [Effrenium voratum]
FVDKVVPIPVQKPVHVPMVQTVQKTVEVPQIEYIDNHVHIPVQKHRHVPVHIPIEKPVEVTVIETTEKIVDVPVVKQIEVPQVQTIEKIVEIPLVQTVEKVVEVPQVGQTTQGAMREVDIPLQPRREEHPAQVVQQVMAGPDHPVHMMQADGQVVPAQPQMGAPQMGAPQMGAPQMGMSQMMAPPTTQGAYGGSVSAGQPIGTSGAYAAAEPMQTMTMG